MIGMKQSGPFVAQHLSDLATNKSKPNPVYTHEYPEAEDHLTLRGVSLGSTYPSALGAF